MIDFNEIEYKDEYNNILAHGSFGNIYKSKFKNYENNNNYINLKEISININLEPFK